MYGCVTTFLERYQVLRAWWMMVTAVKVAHADENPNRNVTSVRDSRDGVSGLYHGGIKNPPILLGAGVSNTDHIQIEKFPKKEIQ